jgi:hypothetical protein
MKRFIARRGDNKLVGFRWILNNASQIFKEQYPQWPTAFTFSYGWLQGFLRRNGVSWRRIIRQATKLLVEYERYIKNFLRRVCRVLVHPSGLGPQNRFLPSMVLNLDETPIPFEFLDGCTYDIKGNKTVAGKTKRNTWTKRKATLILYIFVKGDCQRIKAKIIFYGIPSDKGGKAEALEKAKYHPRVTVEFNKTAYNTKELFSKFIDKELAAIGVSKDNPLLLIIDCAASHKTPNILRKLKELGIEVRMIPPRLIGLLQPLDTHINRLFKALLKEETEKYIDAREERLGCVEKWSVSDKRIMTTHTVFNAVEQLARYKKDIIIKSFRDTGIFMAPDKSEDCLIRIKGFEDKLIELGDIEFRDREIEGYEYQPIETKTEDTFELGSEVEQTMDFLGLSILQLKECCKKRGIKGYSKWKREELKDKLLVWQKA